jgi:hypothetical protein
VKIIGVLNNNNNIFFNNILGVRRLGGGGGGGNGIRHVILTFLTCFKYIILIFWVLVQIDGGVHILFVVLFY